jgi:hypothetical protein
MSSSAASGTPPQPMNVNVNISEAGAPTGPPREPSLPLGVAVLAVVLALFGIASIALAILTYEHYSIGWLHTYLTAVPNLKGYTGTTGEEVSIVVGLVTLGTAVGLWRLSMVALVIALLVLIYEMAVYGYARQFESVEFLLSLVIFLYLLAVSRHFT